MVFNHGYWRHGFVDYVTEGRSAGGGMKSKAPDSGRDCYAALVPVWATVD